MKEMKKIISLLLCAVMILSVCAACGSAPAATATAAPTGDTGPITVTDQAGSTVEVPRRIDRIAVVGIYPLPSVLTVFFNSAKKIVAMPEQSMLRSGAAPESRGVCAFFSTHCLRGIALLEKEKF